MPLRDADRRMRSAVDRFVERADLSPFEVYDPQGVKIVVHRPSGLRTIGVYDFRTDHALFFGQMHY